MDSKQFDGILKDTLSRIEDVLGSKADEYARGDRLHNFKVAAKLAGSTPEMALRGMMSKHIVSVWDLIADVENGKIATLRMWNEKIIDSINYLILLRALVYERYDLQPQ